MNTYAKDWLWLWGGVVFQIALATFFVWVFFQLISEPQMFHVVPTIIGASILPLILAWRHRPKNQDYDFKSEWISPNGGRAVRITSTKKEQPRPLLEEDPATRSLADELKRDIFSDG